MEFLLAPFRFVGLALAEMVRFVRGTPGGGRTWFAGAVSLLVVVALISTLQHPRPLSTQLGPAGTGMNEVYNPRMIQQTASLNTVVPALPPVALAGRRAGDVYKNIQVLKDVDANEFLRLMAAMTQWVAPQTGCSFCHSMANMADDSVYTKTIARRMLQMTMATNAQWSSHVAASGVTCGTCHRGRAIPEGVWFTTLTQKDAGFGVSSTPSAISGLTTLPGDPLTPYLLEAQPIRVEGNSALPQGNTSSTMQTDYTYGLMIHFANSLGVGCTFCHNTRAFDMWDQGTPFRTTAWAGIKMVRDLNLTYMLPLDHVFPADLRGVAGDSPKISCLTCHNGAYKPFYGASTLTAYPELKGPAAMKQAANTR